MSILINFSNIILQSFLNTMIVFNLNRRKVKFDLTFIAYNLVLWIVLATFEIPCIKAIQFLNTICLFTTNYILMRTLLKKSRFASLLIEFLTLLIFAASEILAMLTLFMITGNNFNVICASERMVAIGGCISTVYIFIIHLILDKFLVKNSKNKLNDFSVIEKNRDTFYLLLLIFILVLPKIFTIMVTDYSANHYLILMSVFESFVLMLVLIQKIQLSVLKNKLNIELENANLTNKTLTSIVDSLRGFKHDMSNTISAINGYILLDDFNGIKNYFENGVNKEMYSIKHLNQLSLKTIRDPGVYNLIASKFFKAQDSGIEMKLNFSCNLATEDLENYVYDFTKILGILLDNAIEATEKLKVDKKSIYLEIYKDSSSDDICIRIINKFIEDKSITVENIYSNGFSTKKIKSGFGLYEVKKIIKKLNIFDLNTTISKNKFTQELKIHKLSTIHSLLDSIIAD